MKSASNISTDSLKIFQCSILKGFITVFTDRQTDFFHQMIVEPEIMKHRKPESQHLARLQQMPHIRPAETPAGRTAASFFDRPLILFIALILQI